MAHDGVEKVLRAVLDLPPSYQFTADQSLEEDLGVDSLFLMSLVVGIEAEFGIELLPESITSLRTVGDIEKEVAVAQRLS